MHFAYSNKILPSTREWVVVEVADRYINARTMVPKVINEFAYIEISVWILSNVDMNVTSISVDFGEARLYQGNWIIGNTWEVRGGRSFSLRYGTSETVVFNVRPPHVEATSNYAFMLTIVGSSRHFDSLQKEAIRTVRSEMIEIQLQNSFLIPTSMMLATAILEFPMLLFFVTPNNWKATVVRKLRNSKLLRMRF